MKKLGPSLRWWIEAADQRDHVKRGIRNIQGAAPD